MSDSSELSRYASEVPLQRDMPPSNLDRVEMAADMAFGPNQSAGEELPEAEPQDWELSTAQVAGGLVSDATFAMSVDVEEAKESTEAPTQVGMEHQQLEEGYEARDHNREQRLGQLVAHEPTFASQQQAKMTAVAESIAGRLANPDQQHAVRTYADALKWSLFGAPTEAPPPGLLPCKDGVGYVLDGRIPYLSAVDAVLVHTELYKAGIDQVDQAIETELAPRQEAIREIASEHLRESPACQYLQSFEVEQPQTLQERPLTPYWRTVLATPLEKQLADYEPGSAQAQRVQRQLRQLEDETKPTLDAAPAQQTGIQRARAHFAAEILERFNASPKYKETGLSVRFDPEYDEVQVVTDTDSYDVYKLIQATADELAEALFTGSEQFRSLDEDFLEEAIFDILRGGSSSLEEAVDSATSQANSSYANRLTWALRVSRRPDVRFQAGLVNPHIRSKDAPLGYPASHQELVPYEVSEQQAAIYRSAWIKTFQSSPEFSSEATLAQQLRTVRADVERYAPGNYRTGARLVLMRQRAEGLPARDSANEALVLRYRQPLDDNRMPHVVGYVPVSADGTRFGFAPDPNGDPYLPCDALLPNDGAAALARMYQQIGLPGLAAKVYNNAGLTVSQLVEAIRDTSRYYIPSSGPTPDSLWTRIELDNEMMGTPQHLEHFRRFVSNSALHVQCTASANFLRLSLDTVFGAGHTSLATGAVIYPDTTIMTGVSHMQLAFAYEGHWYLLDATPSAPPGWGSNPVLGRRHSYAPDAQIQPARMAPPTPVQPQMSIEAQQPPTRSREERLLQQYRSFERLLQVAMRAQDRAALVANLLKQPEHDPVRMAYELAHRAAQGVVHPQEDARQLSRIEQFASASPDIRTELGYGHYPSEWLAWVKDVAFTIGQTAGLELPGTQDAA